MSKQREPMSFGEIAGELVKIHQDSTDVVIAILRLAIRTKELNFAVSTQDLSNSQWRHLWYAVKEMQRMLDNSLPRFELLEFDRESVEELAKKNPMQ